MNLLTIETTCDETAAAVVTDRLEVLGSVVASQDALHGPFGGVVPEIASRSHVERIVSVIDAALRQAGVALTDLDAVAVANTPGLAGSLLVGLSAAKALAVALDIPLVAVNHVHAHLYACRIAFGESVFPSIGLVVSGGHTSLFRCLGPLDFEWLGGTIDDAAGEAFDKVAGLLGLGFPGGPAIQRAAAKGNARRFHFPRSFARDPGRLDFSFSGLKTAVRYQIVGPGSAKTPASTAGPAKQLTEQEVADLAASFQEAVVEVLLAKARHALAQTGLGTLCIGGGVAANARLRERLDDWAAAEGVRVYIAPRELCTDNAVMGAIAIERLQAGLVEPLDLDVTAGLMRGKIQCGRED
ncbi:MAG TPA: tRNA (adenosine(37)-N6)-threonylcarbamoyltransferase complex transferase subunit TsaD, partial [Pirellulales bacterium]|nr:tRNA (adenosine(37)-N6)-threonylcarbamoyltransferase complex transferase subunit TsaD [Pirellulales bacterium]